MFVRSARKVLSVSGLTIFGVAGVLATGIIQQGCSGTNARSAVQKPITVPVVAISVVARPVPVNIVAVGNVEAYSTISVKAQVGGELKQAYFKEGEFVKKGSLLFLIDP